ncbi:MAG: hypothetical protein Q8920_01135 [Bacillota bacterium]|nr:hypothetical protein [Bacillota bacterium]
MNIYILALLINFLIAAIYSVFIKIFAKYNFLPRIIIISALPFFGLIMMFTVDILAKNKSYDPSELIAEDEINPTFSEVVISDENNINFNDVLSIDLIFEIKDSIQRRKRFFNCINQDYTTILPFLNKALLDEDPEIVHYSSAAITDIMRKTNENFCKRKNEFQKKQNDIKNCKLLIDAYLDLIEWEELNNTATFENRKSLFKVFNTLFSIDNLPEEKYFINKIKNELILMELYSAYASCKSFISKYPRSENSYLALLEFCYLSNNPNIFIDTLQAISEKDLLLTDKAAGMVNFWNRNILT